MTHSRSKLFAALGSAALVLTFWLVNPAIAADRLRIGLSSFTPINAAIWIAEDKGLFKKYGIDPEVIVVGGASAGGVSSLIAGDIQFLDRWRWRCHQCRAQWSRCGDGCLHRQ